MLTEKERKAIGAARKRNWILNMTPERRKAHYALMNAKRKAREVKKGKTPEGRAEQLAKQRAKYHRYIARLTPKELAAYKAKKRQQKLARIKASLGQAQAQSPPPPQSPKTPA